MKTLLLKLAICLLACCYARSDNTDADQNKSSTCPVSQKCYNPFWCERVLSARECSNRSRCCTDVYNKVECLTELLQSTSKTCKGSTEKVVNLTKNVSLSESQLETFKKEIDELKTLANDNDKVAEISTLKTDISLVKTRLDSFDQKALDVSEKHNTFESEMKTFKQHNSNTDVALKKLDAEFHSTSDEFNSLKSTVAEQRDEVQTQIFNLSGMLDKNISNFESKWHDLLVKETELTDHRLNSFESRWTEIKNKFDGSITILHDNIEASKDKSNHDLQATTGEMKENIKSIETQTQELKDSFETFQRTIEDDVKRKVNNVHDSLIETINKKSDSLSSKINELENKIDDKTSDIGTELTQLTGSLRQSKEDLERKMQKETETLHSEVSRNSNGLDKRLTELSADTQKEFEDTKNQVSEMKKDIEEFKQESVQNLETEKKSLTDLIQRKISEVQTETGNSIEKVLKDIEVLKNEIGQRIKHEVEQLSKQTIEVNQTLNEQKQKVDIILPNTFNKEMFIIAFLVLVVLLAINYCIVYVLVKRTSPSQPVARRTRTDSGTSTANFGEEPRSPLKVYDRLAFSKSLPNDLSAPLKDCVGVISFYEDSQKHHKRLLKSVKEHLPERLRHDDIFEYQVVRRHEHIRGIPKAKLCIMFVEFSERHVIIEESGLGLGDLKRKTAESINEMGACLMIVYVKDPGSRSLKSSELFNGSIHCAKTQPELLDLSNNKRFLSIYDKFTDNQTERIVDVITANIGYSGNKHNLRLNLESLSTEMSTDNVTCIPVEENFKDMNYSLGFLFENTLFSKNLSDGQFILIIAVNYLRLLLNNKNGPTIIIGDTL